MKQIYFTLIFAGFLAAANAETFTGVITDTMCGAKHGMMRGQPDDQCVKMCVKGQYVYALFDGTNIFKLRAHAIIDSHWSDRIVPGGQGRMSFDAKAADVLWIG